MQGDNPTIRGSLSKLEKEHHMVGHILEALKSRHHHMMVFEVHPIELRV
jgi:hypothetical protein